MRVVIAFIAPTPYITALILRILSLLFVGAKTPVARAEGMGWSGRVLEFSGRGSRSSGSDRSLGRGRTTRLDPVDAGLQEAEDLVEQLRACGPLNWTLPAWLDRILPRISVEGPNSDSEVRPPERCSSSTPYESGSRSALLHVALLDSTPSARTLSGRNRHPLACSHSFDRADGKEEVDPGVGRL
jgi:hypothetical protein